MELAVKLIDLLATIRSERRCSKPSKDIPPLTSMLITYAKIVISVAIASAANDVPIK